MNPCGHDDCFHCPEPDCIVDDYVSQSDRDFSDWLDAYASRQCGASECLAVELLEDYALREEAKRKQRERYWSNPEHRREYKRVWYAKHKDAAGYKSSGRAATKQRNADAYGEFADELRGAIIKRFGTVATACKTLNIPYHTVYAWITQATPPSKSYLSLLMMAFPELTETIVETFGGGEDDRHKLHGT